VESFKTFGGGAMNSPRKGEWAIKDQRDYQAFKSRLFKDQERWNAYILKLGLSKIACLDALVAVNAMYSQARTWKRRQRYARRNRVMA
jgi:DNA-binding transcriptional regulator YbjK